jgi:hypothetical protein
MRGLARRVVAFGLVLFVASMANVDAVSPALAYAPPSPVIPETITTADKLPIPGFVVTALVDAGGILAPASRAYDALEFTVDNWETNSTVIDSNVLEGVSIAEHVPGFTLGEKIGGWFDDALGIGPDKVVTYTPYSGEALGTSTCNGFTPCGQPWSTPDGSLTNITVGVTGLTYAGTSAEVAHVHFTFRYNRTASGFFSPNVSAGFKCANGTTSAGSILVAPTASIGPGVADYVVDKDQTLTACSSGNGGLGRGTSWGIQAPAMTGGGATFTAISPAPTFYPTGDPLRPGDYTATPLRQWEAKATCNDDTYQSVFSTGFREDQPPYPPWPIVPKEFCNDHDGLKRWDITLDNTSLTVLKTVESWVAPTALTTTETDFPECLGHVCVTTLWKLVGGQELDCFVHPDDCAQWATDPDRSTLYTCTYGPSGTAFADLTDIGLEGCYAYGPTFDKEKRAQGVKLSDPSSDPGSQDCGNGGCDNDPKPKPSPPPVSGESPCWPHGWGIFNPLEWVLRPLKCAFIPDPQAVEDTLSETWATVSTRPPVSIALAAGTILTNFGGAALSGTCSGNIADFGNTLTVPCVPPSGIAPYVTALNVLLKVALCGLAAWGIWHYVEEGLKEQ